MKHVPPHLFDEIVHKAFSSNIRRTILITLAKKQMYLSEIANEVDRKPQTVDFHLNILSEIGLVESEWLEGKKYYRIKDKKILEALEGKKAVPHGFHPKPPHEIVSDEMKKLNKRIDVLEKKIDLIIELVSNKK